MTHPEPFFTLHCLRLPTLFLLSALCLLPIPLRAPLPRATLLPHPSQPPLPPAFLPPGSPAWVEARWQVLCEMPW